MAINENAVLVDLFNEVYDKFKMKFYKNIFKRFEDRSPTLTVLELFCVEIIYALKRPTISQLTEFMETSQPNTAYRVASLVKKGYVKKVQSTDDKREFYLEVTDKYYGYSDIKEQYINVVIDRLRKQISREEIEHFERLLRLMTNELMTEIPFFNAFQCFFLFGIFLAIMSSSNLNHL